MKKLIYIILVITPFYGRAEKFEPKDYYLVDSLNFHELQKDDISLIEQSLKIFHSAKDDTSKVNAINLIVEQGVDNKMWSKYNQWVYGFINTKLKNNYSSAITFHLKKSLVDAQVIIGNSLMDGGKYVESINILEDALQIAKNIGYMKGEADALYYIGFTYYNSGNLEVALKYYNIAINVNKKLKDYLAIATNLNNIAMVYDGLGNVKESINYYVKSLSYFKKIKNNHEIATTISNLSNLHLGIGEVEIAMKYDEEALQIFKKLDEKEGIASILNSMGFIQYQTGNTPKAFEYLDQGYEIAKIAGRKDLQGQSMVFKGYIYGLNKEYSKAHSIFIEALKIFEELNNFKGISNTLGQISNNYRKQGDYKNAREFATKAMKASEASNDVFDISESAWLVSNINEQQGDYKEALKFYKYHIEMRDSVINKDNQQDLIKQQMNYEYQKKETILTAEYKQTLAIEKKEKQQQRIITYFTVIGLIIVVALLIFIFNRLKVTQKQKLVIEDQKKIVELQNVVVEEKNQEIMDSITYAKRIQNAILPPSKLVKEYLKDSFILYKPKDIVAGDFYWMEHASGKVLFAAADCTGHGVPGAMVSVVCNNAMNRSVREYGLTEPGEILTKTREIVIEEFEKSEDEVKDGMDIALCSLEGNLLKYAGANNPLWIIRKDSVEIEEIKADKQPIGKYFEQTPFTTHNIELQKGDSIYIFSDGYADQFGGEKGKKFKAANFKKLILSIQNNPIEQQSELINEAFENWKGELEQLDDVCVIGVKI